MDASHRIARRDGIDAVTVRSLCDELGITAPALYRYFPAKELILDEMIDTVIGRTALPGPDAGDWAERLRLCYLSVHDEVAPYRGLARRLGHRLPEGGSAARNGLYLQEILSSAGVPDADADKVIFTIFVYTWGHLLAAEALGGTGEGDPEKDASRAQFLWGLDHLLDSFRQWLSVRTP